MVNPGYMGDDIIKISVKIMWATEWLHPAQENVHGSLAGGDRWGGVFFENGAALSENFFINSDYHLSKVTKRRARALMCNSRARV